MRIKTTTAALALALAAGTTHFGAAAETLVTVSFLDESRPAVTGNITPESKLVFGGSPYFDFSQVEGATGRINIADVQRITFSGGWMGVNMAKVESQLRLRENPVGNTLSIVGFDTAAEATLSVFTIAGREAIRIPAWRGEDVNVSELPQGIYILRINRSTLKFIKK